MGRGHGVLRETKQSYLTATAGFQYVGILVSNGRPRRVGSESVRMYDAPWMEQYKLESLLSRSWEGFGLCVGSSIGFHI